MERLHYFVEAQLGRACGEDSRQQRGFSGVAEESNLRGAQQWSKDARNLSKSLRSLDQQRRGNGALAHGNHRVRAAAAIAQVPGRIEGQTDAIAIAPRLAGEYGNLSGHGHAAALQRFAQDCLFEGQLALIVRVLVMAAAASAEVRAGRYNALRCSADNLLGLGGRVA